MPPNVDEEDGHHLEVYAHFGLAVFLAQVLENGLINALVMFDFIPKHSDHIRTRTDWSDAFDAFSAAKIDLTMGNLIRALGKAMTLPDALEGQLRQALHRRSYRVHHYFWDNVALFGTTEGRDRLIKDLQSYQEVFKATDDAVTAILEPVMQHYGMTEERLSAALAEWQEELSRGAGMPFQPAPRQSRC